MQFLSREESVNVRERRLKNLFMSTTAWTALLIYRVLYQTQSAIHGHAIQEVLEKDSGGTVQIPNSVIYPLLSKMKREGFVDRDWEDRENPNTRHRRFYRMTEAGADRYRRLKGELLSPAESYDQFIRAALTHTVPLLSKDDGEDIPLNISSFLALWVLTALREPIYGSALKRQLEPRLPLWKISDGTLYPLLSELEQNGYITSTWGLQDDATQSRSIRIYQIHDKGRAYMKKTYGLLYLEKLETAARRSQFTCNYVFNA